VVVAAAAGVEPAVVAGAFRTVAAVRGRVSPAGVACATADWIVSDGVTEAG
jgi:hypothetical protein